MFGLHYLNNSKRFRDGVTVVLLYPIFTIYGMFFQSGLVFLKAH